MDVIDFKNILWNNTRKISEKTTSLINTLCEHHGITTLQGRILIEIQHHGSHTIGSLASRLNIAEPMSQRCVKSLRVKVLLNG